MPRPRRKPKNEEGSKILKRKNENLLLCITSFNVRLCYIGLKLGITTVLKQGMMGPSAGLTNAGS